MAHRGPRRVSAVSIRDVATEAGLAVGSVRHVFNSKAELLEYSMALVHERVAERVQAHFTRKDPRKLAEAVLAEMLPLDDRRRVEMAVNMAVVAESPSHPSLRRVALDAQRAIAGDVRRCWRSCSRTSSSERTSIWPTRPIGCTRSSTAWLCTHSPPAGKTCGQSGSRCDPRTPSGNWSGAQSSAADSQASSRDSLRVSISCSSALSSPART